MKLCKETMIKAYKGTSFSPEKRGASDFEYYSQLLKDDLSELGENQGNYESKFITKLMSYYHKRSSCVSAMISGPANFPVRQQEKKWNSADKAFNDFYFWREKYFKAVNRVRTLSPEEEIDKTLEELEKITRKRDMMKEFNKLAKKIPSERERVKLALDMFPTKTVEYFSNEIARGGFPSWSITSKTTKIRERKKKLEVMRVRIEHKEEFKPIEFEGGSVYIENDRVIIAHDEKPEREVIQAIKSNGFRWSPKMGNWCRKHTGNAVYAAECLVKNVFGGVIA